MWPTMIFAPVITAQGQHMAEKVKASRKLCGVKKDTATMSFGRCHLNQCGIKPCGAHADSMAAPKTQYCVLVFLHRFLVPKKLEI